MAVLIQRIERSQRVKNRWLIHLEDGAILRVSESELVDFSLYAGMELDNRTLEQLSRAANCSALKEKALQLLAARPFSRQELITKLAGRETPSEDDVQQVADRLEELGLLNDGEYAKKLVSHYAAKGYGVYKLRDELYRRGVPREFWEDALAELEDSSDAIDAFLRKKLTCSSPDRRELKRVSDALSRRGYTWAEISAALRRLGADTED
ncbi:MAG: Regulatory protein RecX [Oscillospiraceae bacterium]|nr:Regulatory protein RecX [Oscillospiraceae bacterium]